MARNTKNEARWCTIAKEAIEETQRKELCGRLYGALYSIDDALVRDASKEKIEELDTEVLDKLRKNFQYAEMLSSLHKCFCEYGGD